MKSFARAMRARFDAAHVNHKRIARGALLTGLFVLAAKAFVAFREIAIAWRYGVSAEVDAYQLAFTFTTWLPTTLAAMFTAVLVPRLVALRRDEAAYDRFVAELNGAALLLGLALTVLTLAGAPLIIELLAGNLTADLRALAQSMALQFAPIALFALATGYLSTRLQARERFGYSFLEAVPAIVITLLVVVAPAGAGVSPLVWGTLLGAFIPLLWLAQMTRSSEGGVGSVRFTHRSEQWRTIYGPLAIMGGAQLVITAAIPIDQAFATSLGEGGVAVLGYATRIIGLLTTLGYVVVARALLPVLSSVAADGDYELGRRQALRWSWLLFGAGLVAVAIGWFAAPLGVRILFERGAFDARDTELVTEVVRYGLLQLPLFFASVTLVQWVAAANRYGLIFIGNAVALLVKLVANWLLVERMGAAGIMVATALMYAVTWTLTAFLARGIKASARSVP